MALFSNERSADRPAFGDCLCQQRGGMELQSVPKFEESSLDYLLNDEKFIIHAEDMYGTTITKTETPYNAVVDYAPTNLRIAEAVSVGSPISEDNLELIMKSLALVLRKVDILEVQNKELMNLLSHKGGCNCGDKCK